MSPGPHPVSLAAERAVRQLRATADAPDSVELAARVLTTRIADETTAARVLRTAFAGDPRLTYEDGRWRLAEAAAASAASAGSGSAAAPRLERDRVWIVAEGGRPARGAPFTLTAVHAIRMRADDVVAACGGAPVRGRGGDLLRRTFLDTIDGAVVWLHDPPGAASAVEEWLDEPLGAWISLRRIAARRLGLPMRHELGELADRLEIDRRETDDPVDAAETADRCLAALRREDEDVEALRDLSWPGDPGIDFSELAFDREDLRAVPHAAGIYRFFDDEGRLLYVGKAKDLHRRLHSYFGPRDRRGARVARIVERLHAFEVEITGSELEATLHEARAIAREIPEKNVQRRVHPRDGRPGRPGSILILEPGKPPAVLTAFLIRDGRWLGKVAIGPRGGGLKKIRRWLDDRFFSIPDGPTDPAGDPVDLELVTRWLAAHRDDVVAFDPTDLKNSDEVILRLEYFLAQGGPIDPDGRPVLGR